MSEVLNCLEFEERLSDFEEGTLAPEHADAMRQHARACATCAELLAAVRQTAVWLAELPQLEMPPQLVPAILERTMGRRRQQVTWRATLESLGALVWQPRVAMSFGMALFAVAVLLNATGVNLRRLRWSDLTPRQVAITTERGLHRSWARGAKYYNDLKVVYEIQAALHEMWQNPPAQPGNGTKHRNANPAPKALRGDGPVLARGGTGEAGRYARGEEPQVGAWT